VVYKENDMTKWMKKLTKEQRDHLKECGIITLAGTEKEVRHQQERRREWIADGKDPHPFHGCWDCLEIGKRLEIEE